MRRVLVIIALLALYALITAPVGADSVQGVKATVWDVNGQNNAPALTEGQQPLCTLDLPDVSHNFDYEPLCGMTEDFIVHFEGFITFPQTGQYRLQAQADDGTRIYIDDQLIIDDWYDKGCCGSISEPLQATAGDSRKLDVWYYENGGGAWIEMWWSINDVWAMTEITAYSLQRLEPPAPSPTPIVTESLAPSPTPSPEPTPVETQSPEPSSTPTEISSPTPSPQITVEPTPSKEPTPQATLGNVIPSYSPTPSPLPSIPENLATAIIPDIVPTPIEARAPNAIPTRKFFNLTIPDITKIGDDMTPEQREQSQAVVVAAVILGQLARFRR